MKLYSGVYTLKGQGFQGFCMAKKGGGVGEECEMMALINTKCCLRPSR